MNGYELAEALKKKQTLALIMQAIDKLIELEDKLQKKKPKETGKDGSKPSSNEDKTSFFAQREVPDDNGLTSDSP